MNWRTPLKKSTFYNKIVHLILYRVLVCESSLASFEVSGRLSIIPTMYPIG